MSSNTPKLNLYKANPITDGDDLFNIDTMLNENWDKIDDAVATLGDTIVPDINTKVKNIQDRLDIETVTDKGLAAGVTTLSAAKNSIYRLSGISGRSLFNLLDRDGNCESLAPWSFTGASGALDADNKVYGANAIRVTLSLTTGTVSRQVPVTSGKRYVLVGDLKNGNATNLKVYVTGINGSIVSATTASTSYILFTASSTGNLTVGVSVLGVAGQVAYMDGIRLYELSASEYSTANSLNTSGIAAKYPYTEGLTGVLNPYALRWTSPAKVAIAAMLAFQTELLADPATGLQADVLAPTPEGQYVKTSYWKRNDLGAVPWVFNNNGASGSGLKRIGVALANNWVPFATTGIYATKYDGTQLKPQSSTSTTPTVKDGISLWNNGYLYLDVANAETGWGEGYNPTTAEVNAFRLGWRMYTQGQDAYVNTYTGSGTKSWVKMGYPSTGQIPSDAYRTVVPTVEQGSGYVGTLSSYQLVYLLAAPVQSIVVSEGLLSLAEGDNTIEVGAGMIVRERAYPQNGSVTYYYINGSTLNSSKLANKVGKFIAIQKNNRVDPAWSTLGTSPQDGATYGNEQSRVESYRFDPTAVYSATYLVLDKYPTVSFQGSYVVSEKAILKELITDIQQATSRVAGLENRPQDLGYPVNWIMPTLLNGWSNISGRPPVSYMIQNGIVHIRGEIAGGVLGQPAFYLPAGMRPAYSAEYVVYSWSGSAIAAASLVVLKEGAVQVQNGSINQISLGEVLFTTV